MKILLLVLIPFIASFIAKKRTGSFYKAYYLSPKHKAYLEKYFEFYQKLPPRSKHIFSKRVAAFMTTKKFIPRQMKYVSWEMRVLISASAIQLTFGFPKVHLSFFRYILVFPETFYSQATGLLHKGEVNPKVKTIALSWADFVEGYLKPDGRNLGLHEMAHALRLENRIRNVEYDFLDREILGEWEKIAVNTMAEINNGQETFFREYGGVDNEEFFAVAVENFFERPLEFKEKHPLTYSTLCKLLQQDPTLLEKA